MTMMDYIIEKCEIHLNYLKEKGEIDGWSSLNEENYVTFLIFMPSKNVDKVTINFEDKEEIDFDVLKDTSHLNDVYLQIISERRDNSIYSLINNNID